MGTRIDNIDGNTARQIITQYIREPHEDRMRKVFFTNVHSICMAQWDWMLKQSIQLGDLVLPDGSGVRIGGKMLSHPVIENLNGTDFTPTVLAIAEREGWSVYFLGSSDHVVQQCCSNVQRKYPNLRIAGYHHGYFREDEEQMIVARINASRPDILLVALGTPKQELWITRYAHLLEVKLGFAVGGLYDFLAESKQRAPVWMRRLGIEWLFRVLHEPKEKWKRVVIEIPMYFSMLIAKRYVPKSMQRSLRRILFS